MGTVSLDELIKHSLLALRETIQSSSDGLTSKNCSVGIVGENRSFTILDNAQLQPYVSRIILCNFFLRIIHSWKHWMKVQDPRWRSDPPCENNMLCDFIKQGRQIFFRFQWL